jgi:CHAT domain-containing protein
VEYDTLNIRFQPGPRGSYTVIASSPRGEAPGEFRVPFADLDLENFVLRVGRPRRGVRRLDSPEMETARTFGGKLFDELFRGDVRELYHTASAEADSAGKGLRVTLRLGQAPELSNIPWEYLCEEGRFLSVSERTPIVRYLDLKKAHTPLAVTPPLRILGMVSSPSDVVELNVQEEKHRLDGALERLTKQGYVEVVWLEQATLGALLKALERDDFHIFHYIGHGAFDVTLDDGALMLEDERGRGKRVTGMKLGQLLADERTLRLAVLNACEGARTSREDPFAGVAASLVRNEIPSVVAMQFEITDDAAILFAGGLYAALARGSPVDAALASARKAIWADYNDVEWGTPVLFMRIPDGRIFDMRAESGDLIEQDGPAEGNELQPVDQEAVEIRSEEVARMEHDDEVDLGPPRTAAEPRWPTRGGGWRGEPDPVLTGSAVPAERVAAVLSAQAPAEVRVGEEAVIDVRAELAEGATPLAETVAALIASEEPLMAILSIADSGVLEAPDGRILRLAAPSAGKPAVSAFVVRGLAEGSTAVCVLFRQGGSDIGQLPFTISVGAHSSGERPIERSVPAEPRDVLDDEVVALLIEEDVVGDQIRYRCLVTGDVLGLDNAEFASEFLQARAGSTSSASLAYVGSVYRRIVERALLNAADLDLFQRELKAIGTELSSQLFSGELARILWDHRDDIATVKITSFEPYIPWELLRLKHPDTNETDDRHLAEYGLVRSLSGRAFPKTLRAAEWRYLVGTYPNNLYTAIGREVEYLTTALTERRRIEPREIPAEAAAFLDALANPDFDVLHIACHGKTDLNDVESAELVIGDRLLAGRHVGPVSVTATTVREEAKLRERAPLVFLNACQSGQQAPSLTDVGGWPRAFFKAGAGAFIGTSWEVHDKPAATFAESFYEALLDGGTLADAAAKARSEAKKARDASWLAFGVYGQPTARLF